MNQIEDIKFLFIIHKDKFSDFSKCFEIINEDESKDLYFLLQQEWATIVKLKFEKIELVDKFKPEYLNSKLIEVTDNDLILKHSSIWVRDVNHLYEHHLEIELIPNLTWEIKKEFFFRSESVENWIGQIGMTTEAKMIYIIEDFETYHLRWYDNEERKIRLMDIESFNNWEETFEAIKLMVNNKAAHNKW